MNRAPTAGQPPDSGPWIVLTVLVIVLFTAPVSLGGRVYFLHSHNDWTDTYVPMRDLLCRTIAHLRLPLWTDGIYCGFPAFAQSEMGGLSPLSWVGSSGPRSASLTLVLSMIVGALATFRLARVAGLSPPASFLAGVTWPLSGYFLSNLTLINVVSTICLFPLAFSMVEESIARQRPRRLVWLGPTLALALYGGHIQSIYLAGWAILFQLASARFLGPDDRPRPTGAHLGWFAFACVLTCLLAGPQLVPTLEFALQSDRAAGLPLSEVSRGSLPPALLLQWLHPRILSDPSRLGSRFPDDGVLHWTHSGIVAAMALLVAIGRVRSDRRLVRPLVLLSAAVVIAMGRYTPLFSVLLLAPGFSSFRNPSRSLGFAELILALLTGWAMDELLRRSTRPARLAAVGVATVQIVWLFAVAWPVLPTLPASDYPPACPTVDHLRRFPPGRVYALFDQETFIEAYVRAGGWRDDQTPYLHYLSLLAGGGPLLYRIPSAQGKVGLTLPRSETIASEVCAVRPDPRLSHPRTRVGPELLRLLKTMAVRWVLSVRPLDSPDLKESFRTRIPWEGFQVGVHELAAHPRVRLVGEACPARGLKRDLETIMGRSHDPLKTTLVEGLAAPEGTRAPAGSAAIESEEDGLLSITARADRPSWLVVADTFYPGWQASVDGADVPIHRTDLVFRAIRLAPGTHRVLMRYEPASLRWGTLLMLVGLATMGALGWVGRDRLQARGM